LSASGASFGSSANVSPGSGSVDDPIRLWLPVIVE
jgi:hypothetical protein